MSFWYAFLHGFFFFFFFCHWQGKSLRSHLATVHSQRTSNPEHFCRQEVTKCINIFYFSVHFFYLRSLLLKKKNSPISHNHRFNLFTDIVEGDIRLDSNTAAFYRGESRNAMKNVNLWKNGVVPYILDSSVGEWWLLGPCTISSSGKLRIGSLQWCGMGSAVDEWLVRRTLDRAVRGVQSRPGHCDVFFGKTVYSHSTSFQPGV